MANHLNSDQQLDQAVKEALESYEVPFDSSAWTEMEKSLEAAPKTFNPFKKWSFSLNTIIGIAALAGGLLIFKYSTSGADTNDKTAEMPAPVKEQKVQPAPVQPKPQPAVTTATSDSNSTSEETTAVITSQPSQLADQYTLSPDKKKKKKTTTTTDGEATTENTEVDFMKMTENHNNTPAFGDQIDPVKGFIHSTNESDKMKKLAESKLFSEDLTTKPDTASLFKKSKAPETTTDTTQNKRKKDKKKKDPKKGSENGTTTDAGTKTKSSSQDDATAEKTDTAKVKKNTKETPKYKGDRTIIDP